MRMMYGRWNGETLGESVALPGGIVDGFSFTGMYCFGEGGGFGVERNKTSWNQNMGIYLQ